MKNYRHLISQYLSGELNPVNAERFEEALSMNSELRREMKLYQEVDHALADSEVLALRTQLNTMHEPILQQINMNTGKTRKNVTRYVAAAAGIAILIGISVLNMLKNPEYIVNKYYHPYTMTMTTRSADMDIDLVLREALLRYDNEEYREAVIIFEKVLDSDPEMISANLYAGISYFEIREYGHAENSFNKVIEHNDNLYIEQAEWYMGFCYLMTNRKTEAINQFAKIVDKQGYYSDKAKNILKKLK